MHASKWHLASAVLAFVAMASGCNCKSTPAGGADGGDSGTQNGDGGRGGDGGVVCLAPGASCTPASACCNGVCSSGGICVALCASVGATCTTASECCSDRCSNGHCVACEGVGQTCSTGSDCCTMICGGADGGGKACDSIPGQTCSVTGETCATATDCCSNDCQNGYCAHQFTCQADSDICTSNADCCSLNCSAADGGVGLCVAVHGAGPSCTSDGNPCPAVGVSNFCCSHICENLGTGTPICVPAAGCSVAGDPCTSTLECCGNTQGATCSQTCSNVQSCNAPGNICGAPHLPDGGIDSVGTARVDCCPGGGINNEPCFFDPAGVPRCFGQCPPGSPTCDAGCPSINPLVAGCCLSPGEVCNSAGECCNFVPCVPNDAGVLVCTLQSCLPVGALCGTDGGAACCSGTQCLPAGELSTACQVPASNDAGTTCEPNAAHCDAGTECCSAICAAGVCSKPAACQPQGGVCTLSADCCSGLSCNGGKCTTGATCGSPGQACSPTNAVDGGAGNTCCTGLSCVDPVTLATCTGTTACTCELILQ